MCLKATWTKNVFYKIKKLPHEIFRIPDNLVWFMLLGLAFFFSGDVYMRSIALNAIFVFGGLYFLQGLEILRFWLTRFKLSWILKLIVYLLLIIEPPIMLFVALAGLFSIWFNFFGKTETPEKTEG